MEVLDPCCGSRKFYFDKHSPFVIYGDIRDETYTQCDGRLLEVRPDQKMDVTNLPFDDESFSLVIFDPPILNMQGKVHICTNLTGYFLKIHLSFYETDLTSAGVYSRPTEH